MAVSVDDIKNRYPIPVYNYRVTILMTSNPILQAGAKLADLTGQVSLISCSEVSGLKMEIETQTYRHGFSFLSGYHLIPGITKEVNVSIRKGITRQGQYLSDWMNISYPLLKPLPLSSQRKRDILIDLCDEEGLPIVRWTVLGAMPTKLEAPSFKVDTSEMAFEQLDLIAHELQVSYNP